MFSPGEKGGKERGRLTELKGHNVTTQGTDNVVPSGAVTVHLKKILKHFI